MSEELTRKEKRQQRRAERRANRKPFGQSAVGRILKGTAGAIFPPLAPLLDGVGSLQEALQVVSDSTAPPDVKVKLRELALEEERIELEAFEAEVEDRASAREAEVARLKSGGKNRLQYVIGWGSLIGWIGMIVGLFLIDDLTGTKKDIYNIALGNVQGIFMLVASFYFGSSMRK